jgi:hypothetical protein
MILPLGGRVGERPVPQMRQRRISKQTLIDFDDFH